MSKGLAQWWQALSRREQRLLAVMLVLAAPILFWLLVLRPLAEAQADAGARLAQARQGLAQVQAAAPVLKRLEARGGARGGASGDAMTRVRAALDGVGLVAETLEPANDGVRLRLAAVRGPVLLRLLAGLETDGLPVETLSVSRNEDTSLTVSMTVSGGAR
jgi:general secretion pathway protein M